MAQSSDLNFQALSTVQGSQGPLPVTMAAATTIAPTTFVTFVSGTTQVGTITPPVDGAHLLVLIFTDSAPGTTLTTGNINNAVVPTQNLPSFFVYDPLTEKYYGCTTNLT